MNYNRTFFTHLILNIPVFSTFNVSKQISVYVILFFFSDTGDIATGSSIRGEWKFGLGPFQTNDGKERRQIAWQIARHNGWCSNIGIIIMIQIVEGICMKIPQNIDELIKRLWDKLDGLERLVLVYLKAQMFKGLT